MLVPDHGRHSVPFSFGTAGAVLNESIPFRDLFYTLNVLVGLSQCPTNIGGHCLDNQAHLSGVL
jgi:hypothetical protein